MQKTLADFWISVRPYEEIKIRWPAALTTSALRTFVLLVSLAIFGSVQHTVAQPSEFTIVVPFPAGGRTDIGTRIIADALNEEGGYHFKVENRPGSGGVVGARHVAAAAPDGQTLLMTSAALLVSSYTMENASKLENFEAIAVLDDSQPALTVLADSDFQSAEDLIAKAKASPGTLTMGYIPGATAQIIAAGFVNAAGIDVAFVPFKGDADAILALAGGSIDLYISSLSSSKSLLDAGKLRLLAVASDHPLANFPDIPKLMDIGVDFSSSVFNALFATAGTPEEVLDTLQGLIAKVMNNPAVIERLTSAGLNPVYLDREQTRVFLESQDAMVSRITEKLGLQK